MRIMKLLGLGTVAVIAGAVAHADSKDVYGLWLTAAGTAQVDIADCGDGTPCGSVAWIDPDSLEPGVTPETAVDRNNPDPALRDQPVIGMTMLTDFEEKRSDWRGGTIYDAEAGKAYGSRLKKLDDGTLQVKGCIGPICQTQIWTPVAAMSETEG
ncbi:MAG: DUF2147 domain-containing protein [Pseudomonadota bacterium]